MSAQRTEVEVKSSCGQASKGDKMRKGGGFHLPGELEGYRNLYGEDKRKLTCYNSL